jgi:hypothetical protein
MAREKKKNGKVAGGAGGLAANMRALRKARG